MNINEAAEHLRRLAQNNPNRSKTGQLRELYAEIETARKAGVTTEKIVDALNENGLDISLGTFVTLLHRIRRKTVFISSQHGTEPNRLNETEATERAVETHAATHSRGIRIKKEEKESTKAFAASFVANHGKKPTI